MKRVKKEERSRRRRIARLRAEIEEIRLDREKEIHKEEEKVEEVRLEEERKEKKDKRDKREKREKERSLLFLLQEEECKLADFYSSRELYYYILETYATLGNREGEIERYILQQEGQQHRHLYQHQHQYQYQHQQGKSIYIYIYLSNKGSIYLFIYLSI